MTPEYIREKLMADVRWLERAVLAIDNRQTGEEQAQGATTVLNGRGWNAFDASTGTYMANWIRQSTRPLGQRLSGAWIGKARRMLLKYAGQLARIAAANMAAA